MKQTLAFLLLLPPYVVPRIKLLVITLVGSSSFFLSVQGALGDEYHGVGNFSASGIDTDIVASGELNGSFSFTIDVDPNYYQ